MEKKLPNLFKKDINKKHINNKKVFSSKDKPIFKDNDTVENKLKKLFKSSRYIFNIGVIIKTAKQEYDTKIIGRIRNSIITNENIEIPIVEIEDIIIKDRI